MRKGGLAVSQLQAFPAEPSPEGAPGENRTPPENYILTTIHLHLHAFIEQVPVVVGGVGARPWDRWWKHLQEPTNSHLSEEADHNIILIQQKHFSSYRYKEALR